MSIFDDHSSSATLSSFEDKKILEMFKVSNSGASLIPKKDMWRFANRKSVFPGNVFPGNSYRPGVKLPPLPSGVYHSEQSLYKIIFGSHQYDYNKYVDVVRTSGLEMMTYRGKYFYVCNRDQKRAIRKKVMNDVR